MATSTLQCTVCNETVAKYKCPNCRVGYCSVKCFRIHKTEPCVSTTKTESDPASKNTQNQARSSSGTVATKQATESSSGGGGNGDDDDIEEAKHRLTEAELKRLDTAENVRELLTSPDLRALLQAVCNDPNPLEAIRALRLRPDFERLVQEMKLATNRE
ncbi:hypothetical protein GGI07_002384 [Coemansia sp. Benny D115]|nr:hypothetical protein GGI07_002384 [Coemansia sp. Benny D115]